MLPLALRQATTTMLSGRPGPVNIDVPFNVFQEEDDVDLPSPAPPLNAQRSGASPEEIASALDMILKAERPVIFIGHGVTLSEASRELSEFAKKLGIPVISSPNGMGCFDMTDLLSLGFIGRNGAFPANEAGRRADLVVAIGARFDDRSASSWMPGYSWNFPTTKLIHADVDPAELGRNYPPDLGILADARTFLRQLLTELERRGNKSGNTKAWLADITKWRAEWDKFTQPNFNLHASPIRPERIVADCQAVLPDDAILACDVGVNHNWYMQFWKARKPQTMLNSWGFSGINRSSLDRSDAIHSASRSADSATNRREAADFEVPSPALASRSPSGSRTARLSLRVDTLISIRFIAQRPSQSSACAAVQVGSGSSWPSKPRTRGR